MLNDKEVLISMKKSVSKALAIKKALGQYVVAWDRFFAVFSECLNSLVNQQPFNNSKQRIPEITPPTPMIFVNK
jgi:hypothetical protein